MKDKINDILVYVFFFSIIALCFFALSISVDLFIHSDDEMGALHLNIACLLSVIIFASMLINFLIIPICRVTYKYIDKKRHPEKYKPVTTEQIAKDFEALAQALRDNDKENTND